MSTWTVVGVIATATVTPPWPWVKPFSAMLPRRQPSGPHH